MEQQTEQQLLHQRRLFEAEMSSWHTQQLNRRQERMQRLEQEFGEERRMREQAASAAELEVMQHKRDLVDLTQARSLVEQQVDAMQRTLEEMRLRSERAQADADAARADAAQAEAETASLTKEIALLELRSDRSDKAPVAPRGLTQELREAMGNMKQFESEICQLEAELGDVEDELSEKDKTVEILELETEEERLRTHRLQSRIMQLEAAQLA